MTKKVEEVFPIVGFVAVRRVPERVMYLRNEVGRGTIERRKFDIQNVIPDGSIYVHFEPVRRGESKEYGREVFIVRSRDAISTAFAAIHEPDGEPVLRLLRRCLKRIGRLPCPCGQSPEDYAEKKGLVEDLTKLLAEAEAKA